MICARRTPRHILDASSPQHHDTTAPPTAIDMKYFALVVAVGALLALASAGYIRSGWSPYSYSSPLVYSRPVLYSPSYYGGYGSHGGWSSGWRGGWKGGWW